MHDPDQPDVARRAPQEHEHDACHALPFLRFRLLAWSTRFVPRLLAARLGGWYGAPEAWRVDRLGTVS